MKRVLITGDAGFIGRHLSAELTAAGYEVFGVDWSHDGVHHDSTLDLRKLGIFQKAMIATEPEVVVHLAAQVGRLFGEADLIHTLSSNAQMTTLVAHACGEAGVQLVYASTSEIYGDQGMEMCHEDGPKRLPHNLYGLSKRFGEEVAQLYAPKDLVTLRFSMPYGPGVVPGRGRAALPNILWQAATGQSIPIHVGAERSWCFIADTVGAVRTILDAGATGAYNVGRDDDSRLLRDLAVRACKMTGASTDLIIDIEPPQAQTVVKRLATEKIRALGWRPEVEIEEGMRTVLDWVRHFDRNGNRVVVA